MSGRSEIPGGGGRTFIVVTAALLSIVSALQACSGGGSDTGEDDAGYGYGASNGGASVDGLVCTQDGDTGKSALQPLS